MDTSDSEKNQEDFERPQSIVYPSWQLPRGKAFLKEDVTNTAISPALAVISHPDIVKEILSFADRQALKVCLGVSQTFFEIAGPLLYHSISVGLEDDAIHQLFLLHLLNGNICKEYGQQSRYGIIKYTPPTPTRTFLLSQLKYLEIRQDQARSDFFDDILNSIESFEPGTCNMETLYLRDTHAGLRHFNYWAWRLYPTTIILGNVRRTSLGYLTDAEEGDSLWLPISTKRLIFQLAWHDYVNGSSQYVQTFRRLSKRLPSSIKEIVIVFSNKKQDKDDLSSNGKVKDNMIRLIRTLIVDPKIPERKYIFVNADFVNTMVKCGASHIYKGKTRQCARPSISFFIQRKIIKYLRHYGKSSTEETESLKRLEFLTMLEFMHSPMGSEAFSRQEKRWKEGHNLW